MKDQQKSRSSDGSRGADPLVAQDEPRFLPDIGAGVARQLQVIGVGSDECSPVVPALISGYSVRWRGVAEPAVLGGAETVGVSSGVRIRS